MIYQPLDDMFAQESYPQDRGSWKKLIYFPLLRFLTVYYGIQVSLKIIS